jgi:hypothetical protein
MKPNIKEFCQERTYFRCEEKIFHNLDSQLHEYLFDQFDWNGVINGIIENLGYYIDHKINKQSVLNSLKV